MGSSPLVSSSSAAKQHESIKFNINKLTISIFTACKTIQDTMKTQLSPRQLVMLKEFLAELVGTCVLLMCGCGCVAQAVLSGGAHGGMLSINIGWGLGVLLGVLVAGPISGAHLNPA